MRPQIGEDKNPWYGEKRLKKRELLKRIKRRLPNAPALGLSDMTKPFLIYVHDRL
jgi:hypothetical protein